MIERPLMVRWVAGSIPHGDANDVFSSSRQYSTNGVTKAVVYAVLFV